MFPVALFLYFVILINLLLFIFNLIPIPPLDGSHILRHFLPYRAVQVYDRMGMIGLIILFLIGGRLYLSHVLRSSAANLQSPSLRALSAVFAMPTRLEPASSCNLGFDCND